MLWFWRSLICRWFKSSDDSLFVCTLSKRIIISTTYIIHLPHQRHPSAYTGSKPSIQRTSQRLGLSPSARRLPVGPAASSAWLASRGHWDLPEGRFASPQSGTARPGSDGEPLVTISRAHSQTKQDSWLRSRPEIRLLMGTIEDVADHSLPVQLCRKVLKCTAHLQSYNGMNQLKADFCYWRSYILVI